MRGIEGESRPALRGPEAFCMGGFQAFFPAEGQGSGKRAGRRRRVDRVEPSELSGPDNREREQQASREFHGSGFSVSKSPVWVADKEVGSLSRSARQSRPRSGSRSGSQAENGGNGAGFSGRHADTGRPRGEAAERDVNAGPPGGGTRSAGCYKRGVRGVAPYQKAVPVSPDQYILRASDSASGAKRTRNSRGNPTKLAAQSRILNGRGITVGLPVQGPREGCGWAGGIFVEV